MLHLAVRIGGRRIAALFAVACAALGGAALITGTGVLAESGLRSHVPAGRLSGADIVVAADQAYRPADDLPVMLPERATVPASTVDRLAGIPGVTAVFGDVSFPAVLIDGHNHTVAVGDPRTAGHGWSSLTLLDNPRIDGAAPAGPGEIAVESAVADASGVRPGDRVHVTVAGQNAEYRVSAVVSAAGSGILFSDPVATRLAGHSGAVDLIGVRTAPGRAASVAAEIRAQLSGVGLTVATGAGRGDVEAPGAAAARSLLLLISSSLAGVTLLVVGFIMAGAMTVSVGGQRRDLALLRAVGATPRQIRRLAAGQATVVTAVALVPGAALAYVVASQFRRLLVDQGMLPAALPLTFSPLPVVAAALLLVVVAQVAARSAAWRTSHRPATEAVAESRSEPRAPSPVRTTAGLLVIAGATAVSAAPLIAHTPLGATATPLSGILAAIGLALAGPELVRRTGAALARRLPSRVSAPTWLAVANSHGYALRIAGAMTTLAMAVVFTLTYTLTQTTLMNAISGEVRAGTHADVTVSAPELGGVPVDAVDAVRATPGVQAAAPVSATTVLWTTRIFEDTRVDTTSALILTPAAAPVVDLGVRAGSLNDLTGATIAVDTATASAQNATVGRTVQLILGDGAPVTARVVAVYDRGLGFGPVALSRDLAAGHTTVGLDQSILVQTDGTRETHQALAALVASRPGLAIQTGGAGPGGVGGTPPQVWINLAVLAILVGYLLLGIANKLIATTSARRTELAALRLIGTTPPQIRAMMRREAALIVGFALSTGTLLSAIPLVLLGTGFLHRPWAAGPVWLLPATALTVAAIAFAATELPTRQALRAEPAQALAIRE